jgi:hypothetical protein
MQEQKTETINIGGPIDVERLRRELATMSTLSADEAEALVAKYGRLYRSGNAISGKTSRPAAERVPLDPPAGLNRAQRRAWTKKNR